MRFLMKPKHPLHPPYASNVLFVAFMLLVLGGTAAGEDLKDVSAGSVFKLVEGYVDAQGVLIYFKAFGHGPPLLILHGGPGASHDYFLPHLLPLARTSRL